MMQTIFGEVSDVYEGKYTHWRMVSILTDDGKSFEFPSLKFDKGQKVQIEVKEIA